MARAKRSERPVKRSERPAKRRERPAERPDLSFLEPVLERATKGQMMRDGVIRLQFSDGGQAQIRSSGGRAELTDELAAAEGEPLLEIIGDRRRIQAIVDGKKDPRAQFLAGGLRIRGDLGYFSDLALEMGILSEPL